ncbi:MAG: Crp/Fnr family transcriptional regulator [Rhodocyclaceae bacterium]|nr:Crp/Fnr family transcriptional regulator [Rhodocyclaceae bacterium]MCP5232163.1 Crp/Fnr family transcriptional regulator [Zoogloeaceae bacterium]MCB1910548.1 Crp/Fnr family transcriptional regulator [Rhodocyclaceae bacterium]MCP5238533.1 Crp/Fnr family transcriptional regulator [Zoogloeaceae bacterium]MCP5254553.1 Crp/Fnr family transcriptional regulator [Zoogloeaceae bacterium]
MASDTYLDRVDIFAGLNESQLEALRQNSRIRAVLPGTIVVSEGDEPHGLFIVQSGTLKAFLMDENGREITLSLLGEGDYFGELALLDDAPRSASVIALERGELLQLSQQAFLELIENDPKVMHTVVRNLVSRIRSLTDSVRALALVDVFGRISRLFSSLAQEQGDHHVIEQRLTQQEIANLVGASREMVNRILRDLVTGGYIEIEHHRVILLKKLPPRW